MCQVGPAALRRRRDRLPRPDAWCSPGREHVHNGACHCKGSTKTAPGWEYQFTAAVGHLRTAWAAFVDVARTTPATRTAQTIAQVKNVLRRLRAAGHGRRAAPLFVFDAGYSAAAFADGLLGCPAHILVRLAAGSVFYAEPVTWDGKYGRRPAAARGALPGARGLRAAEAGRGPRGRKKPLPPNPGPDEELALPEPRSTAPSAPRPGTASALSSTATAAGSPAGRSPPCPAPSSTSPSNGFPTAATRTAPCGYGTAARTPVHRRAWRAYLARFDIEHAFKLAKGTLGLAAAKVRDPEQADRWVRIIMTACAQLLLARPLAADLRRPWEKQPYPSRPLTPGRVRRGFRNIRRELGTPARVAKPCRPGPEDPKAAAKAQHPATSSQAKPACRAPRTRL